MQTFIKEIKRLYSPYKYISISVKLHTLIKILLSLLCSQIGWTPLSKAVLNGHANVVQYLVNDKKARLSPLSGQVNFQK